MATFNFTALLEFLASVFARIAELAAKLKEKFAPAEDAETTTV